MLEWVRTPGSHRKIIFVLGIMGALGGSVLGAVRAWDRIAPAFAADTPAPLPLDRIEMLVAAVEHQGPEADDLIGRAASAAGVTQTVLKRLLTSLAKRPYRGPQMDLDLRVMVTVHRQLDVSIAGPPPDDTETAEATARLRASWKGGDLDTVRILMQARKGHLDSALADAQQKKSAAKDVKTRQRAVADAALNLGRLALIDTGHPAAARHIRTAAHALPGEDIERRASLLVLAADSFIVAGSHGEGAPALDEAVALTSEAVRLLSSISQNNTVSWTHAQISLGKAYLLRSQLTGNADDLVDAADALRHAVAEAARHPSAAERAGVEHLFARTLLSISEQGEHPAPLSEAAAMLEAGLRRLPRQDAPAAWGLLQRALGSVLTRLAVYSNDPAMAAAAVAAHRLGLEDLPREHAPDEWGQARLEFGVALYAASTVRNDRALAAEGADVLADVRSFFTQTGQAALANTAAGLEAAAREVAARP